MKKEKPRKEAEEAEIAEFKALQNEIARGIASAKREWRLAEWKRQQLQAGSQTNKEG